MEEMLKAYPATANPLLCGGSLLYAGAEKNDGDDAQQNITAQSRRNQPDDKPRQAENFFPFACMRGCVFGRYIRFHDLVFLL